MERDAPWCPIETSQTAVEGGVSPARDFGICSPESVRGHHGDRPLMIEIERVEGRLP